VIGPAVVVTHGLDRSGDLSDKDRDVAAVQLPHETDILGRRNMPHQDSRRKRSRPRLQDDVAAARPNQPCIRSSLAAALDAAHVHPATKQPNNQGENQTSNERPRAPTGPSARASLRNCRRAVEPSKCIRSIRPAPPGPSRRDRGHQLPQNRASDIMWIRRCRCRPYAICTDLRPKSPLCRRHLEADDQSAIARIVASGSISNAARAVPIKSMCSFRRRDLREELSHADRSRRSRCAVETRVATPGRRHKHRMQRVVPSVLVPSAMCVIRARSSATGSTARLAAGSRGWRCRPTSGGPRCTQLPQAPSRPNCSADRAVYWAIVLGERFTTTNLGDLGSFESADPGLAAKHSVEVPAVAPRTYRAGTILATDRCRSIRLDHLLQLMRSAVSEYNGVERRVKNGGAPLRCRNLRTRRLRHRGRTDTGGRVSKSRRSIST